MVIGYNDIGWTQRVSVPSSWLLLFICLHLFTRLIMILDVYYDISFSSLSTYLP